MKFALAVVGLGIAGGLIFELGLYLTDALDWWLDTGFYGLVSAGATTAALLWWASRTEPGPAKSASEPPPL